MEICKDRLKYLAVLIFNGNYLAIYVVFISHTRQTYKYINTNKSFQNVKYENIHVYISTGTLRNRTGLLRLEV